jgi:dimethylamine/trimethylamine dehydrogenase
MANVEVFLASDMTAEQVRELGADHVAIATGATWRPDGMGRANLFPVPGADGASVLTPDDIIAGKRPEGPVIVFDDDHYYMGNIIAELLRGEGHEVTLATPAPCVAKWTEYTLEQEKIERRMVDLGIEILARHRLSAVGDGTVEMVKMVTGAVVTRAATVVSVTARLPNDALYYALAADGDVPSVKRIGDCYGPATIAAAVYEGHRYARELDTEVDPDVVPFHRERFDLDSV